MIYAYNCFLNNHFFRAWDSLVFSAINIQAYLTFHENTKDESMFFSPLETLLKILELYLNNKLNFQQSIS